MPRTSLSSANREVFVNCPFDDAYKPLFRAIVFAVLDCGFSPRSALEIDNAAVTRIDKIVRLVGLCRFGIHDISRTELSKGTDLPRFNMPFELGLFIGAKRFGDESQHEKVALVLDREPYRYQKFLSDIAGQDVYSHDVDRETAIRVVRDWLLPHATGPLAGGAHIAAKLMAFESSLPNICRRRHLKSDELTFVDYCRFGSRWLADYEKKRKLKR